MDEEMEVDPLLNVVDDDPDDKTFEPFPVNERPQLPLTKNPYKYACPFCTKRYTSRSGLLSHKNTVHFKRRPYRCQYCNLHFFTSAMRVGHIHKVHPEKRLGNNAAEDENEEDDALTDELVEDLLGDESNAQSTSFKISCDICGLKFKTMSQCAEHSKAEHNQPLVKELIVTVDANVNIQTNEEPAKDESSANSSRSGFLASFDKFLKSGTTEKEAPAEKEGDSMDLSSYFERFKKKVREADEDDMSSMFFDDEGDTNPRERLKNDIRDQYVCLICNIPFLSTEEFLNHAKMHDPAIRHNMLNATCNIPIKKFTCHVCKKSYDSEEWRDIHLKYHHPDQQEPELSVCDFCFETFTSESERDLHQSVSCKQSKIVCFLCKTKLPNVAEYAKHIKANHDIKEDESTIACPLCSDVTFDSVLEENFLLHFNNTHPLAIFSCLNCEKEIGSAGQFQDHVRESHSNESNPNSLLTLTKISNK